MKISRCLYHFIAFAAIGLLLASCQGEKKGVVPVKIKDKDGFATSDVVLSPNPELTEDQNAIIPNIQYATELKNKFPGLRIEMTGVQDKNTSEWIKLYGTGDPAQNLWIEIDGKPQHIQVGNIDSRESNVPLPVDIVFLVDNSSSMDDEADVIARDIVAWTNSLKDAGFDVKVGCVGHDGMINGAIDLSAPEELSAWLSKGHGTMRTRGFTGVNAGALQSAAPSYQTGGGDMNECPVAALRYADANFSFRQGASRLYLNFTDEPNQYAGKSNFSVSSLKNNWDTSKGTVHTIFSEDRQWDKDESNRLLSEYTGGTVSYTNPSFSNISLAKLPVTSAMMNFHLISIKDIHDFIDGENHDVHLTVKSPDGKIQGERVFQVVFPPLQQ